MVVTKQSKLGSLERAIEIAVKFHAGNEDKAGAPYILHPLRVMLSLETEPERIVAVLHDVVEDCFPEHEKGWQFLTGEGFTAEVIAALGCVTKNQTELDKPGDSETEEWIRYKSFVQRALRNPIARAIKLADLNDNLDITRLPTVSTKDAERLSKYLKARELLLNTDPGDLPKEAKRSKKR